MDDAGIHPGWFIGSCVTAVSAILLWWGNNRYFAGKFDQWQSDVKERFGRLDERIKGIEEMRQQVGRLDERIDGIEEMRQQVKHVDHRIEGIEEMRQQVKTNTHEVGLLRDLRHEAIGLRKAFEALTDLMRHKL